MIPFDERKTWNTLWIVDPLDGTKEFIKRNGEFTVNIALIEKGTPVAGIIYVPVTQTLYAGMKHEGAFKLIGVRQNIPFSEIQKRGEKLPCIQPPSTLHHCWKSFAYEP